MKSLLIIILALGTLIDPGKIGKVNTAKSEARKAYAAGDYKKAIQKYRFLTDSLDVKEDEVMLNLANAYYQSKDTTNATATYASLTGSTKPQIRSKAQQQLGILNHKQGKLEEALNNFKQAIKADADNIDARYNYEILKKKLEEQKKQQEQNQQNRDKQNKDQEQKEKDPKQNKEQEQKDQQQKDQQKKEQQEKEQKEKEQQQKDQESKEEKEKKEKEQEQKSKEQKENENKEKKENSPELSEKLQQMKISEEKAKMILEAMKNQEIQYLQQNKRKATKQKDRNKPDW